jgi:hypothetical protein
MAARAHWFEDESSEGESVEPASEEAVDADTSQ